MLSKIHLQNFKASTDLKVRLAPLTVLAGLNGSGKSSLLQAIATLRQSYATAEEAKGLSLSGHLVQLGKGTDVLSEGAASDIITITIEADEKEYYWESYSTPESDLLLFLRQPSDKPLFLTSAQFQFLQADRMVPKTLYPQATQTARDKGFLGTHGEYTADFLAENATRHVPKKRLAAQSKDSIDSALMNKAAPTEGLLDQVAGWLQHLSPGARIKSERLTNTDDVLLNYNYVGQKKDKASSKYYRPTNVGFGLTYSLPILVACLATKSGGLLLLENPEAHLHPRGQAALGELLARCAADGVQIIVETHSDHVLNGIRLAVKNNIIKSDETVLHFFTRSIEEGDVSIESPAILANGRLSNWPENFFDQWDKSIDALLD